MSRRSPLRGWPKCRRHTTPQPLGQLQQHDRLRCHVTEGELVNLGSLGPLTKRSRWGSQRSEEAWESPLPAALISGPAARRQSMDAAALMLCWLVADCARLRTVRGATSAHANTPHGAVRVSFHLQLPLSPGLWLDLRPEMESTSRKRSTSRSSAQLCRARRSSNELESPLRQTK